ncbi:hypothetical protein ACWGVR_17655 [Streptomyces xanthophaeus]
MTGATGATGATGPAGVSPDVGASAFALTNQTIPNSLSTKVAFSGTAYATGMTFDDANDALVVTTPGRYLVKGKVLWFYTPASNSGRALSLFVNTGLVAVDSEDAANLSGISGSTRDVSTILTLAAGDAITLAAFQTTGNNATLLPLFGDRVLAPQLQAELLEP